MIHPGIVKLTAVLCVPVLFVSCATTGGATRSNIHNPRIVAARHTYSQGLILGTAAGAMVGLTVGQIVARNARNAGAATGVILAATLIGAGVGAIAGGLYAEHVVNQRNKFANAELYLDGCIAQARHSAQHAEAYNRTLSTELAATRKGNPEIRGMIEDSRAVLDSLNREIGLQRRGAEQAQSDNASPDRIEALRQEIAILAQRRADLQFYIDRMSKKMAPAKG